MSESVQKKQPFLIRAMKRLKKKMTRQQRRNTAAQEAQIRAVMEKTGWSQKEAAAQMADAKQRLGISYQDYNRYNFHEIPVPMQRGRYQKIVNYKSIRQENRNVCIEDAMQKTGWSREEAAAQIAEAVKRLGITYVDYRKYEFCLLSPEAQEAKMAELRETKRKQKLAQQKQLRQEREAVIAKVMEKTGWDHSTTKAKIQDAKRRTNCTYSEYWTYQFYALDEQVQNEIFLMDLSRKLKTKYTTDRQFGRMLCNKAATNLHFSDCVKRPWCMNADLSYEEFLQKFEGCKKLVYKPLGGNWGRGVVGFEMTGDLHKLYEELMSYPEGVIEQFVVQHPKMNALSPTAVNTVRIVTISSNHEPVTADGKMMDIAYASLKIGGVTSNIVDNLHGGGMVAGIDLETGKLITDGADDQGNVYAVHPVTGTIIKGFEIPYFKEAIAMVTKAIQDKKLDGYLGWDVAISEQGPELIETNLMPGVILLTMPYLAEKKGMKSRMEQYYL